MCRSPLRRDSGGESIPKSSSCLKDEEEEKRGLKRRKWIRSSTWDAAERAALWSISMVIVTLSLSSSSSSPLLLPLASWLRPLPLLPLEEEEEGKGSFRLRDTGLLPRIGFDALAGSRSSWTPKKAPARERSASSTGVVREVKVVAAVVVAVAIDRLEGRGDGDGEGNEETTLTEVEDGSLAAEAMLAWLLLLTLLLLLVKRGKAR